jgi:tetratricopeptide (TPR) repeat protein
MASMAWKSLVVSAGILALASEPVVGQDQEKAKDLAICAGVGKDAEIRLEACTRSLERDRNLPNRQRALILTYRAVAWKAKGDLDSAVGALTDAIAADPDFPLPYRVRADIFRDRGQCDRAIADYDRFIDIVPDSPVAYLSRGICWIQKDGYDPAIGNFDEAIRLDPNNANRAAEVAWAMKGRLHYLKGDLDRAIAEYGEAIKLDPTRATFFIDRATVWSNKPDGDRALADLEKAVKLDPNNAQGAALAWNMKAGLRFAKADADGALADYDQAIRLDPQRADFYFSRGIVWGSKREFAHAIADFDQAIRRDPDNARGIRAPALDWKGRSQSMQGDVDGAVAAYDEAIRLDPKFAFAYQNRGDAFKDKGEYARAIESYDRAIDLQLREPQIYASRGLMHFYSGDFPKAAADFTHAVQGQVDAYSLLLFYISLARASQDAKDAKDALTRGASRLESRDWPYPVVEMFLGKRSPEAVRAAAGNSDQQCEMQYYAGEWQLLQGRREPAHAALQAAVDSCPKNFVEYRAAAAELKRWSP